MPYFLQVLFSEMRKACDDESLQPSTALVGRVYRDKVLGEDCKTYFDHYYTRFRLYYPPHLEQAAKRILRELAEVGAMSRDACRELYRQATADKAVRLPQNKDDFRKGRSQ